MEELQTVLRTLATVLKDNEVPEETIMESYEALSQSERNYLALLLKVVNVNSKNNLKNDSKRNKRLGNFLALNHLELSDSCETHVRQWHRDIRNFFSSLGQIPKTDDHSVHQLSSLYWRKARRSEETEVETIRDRFDSLALYDMAVQGCYHTGRSWCDGGLQMFRSGISGFCGNDHTEEEKENNLDKWVEAGSYYQQWIDLLTEAEEAENVGLVDHCGYLIMLPQRNINETNYISRELRKPQRKQVAYHLKNIGILGLAQRHRVFPLGQRIRQMQRIGFSTASAAGIAVETTFNRNSTISCERPYDSAIFSALQEGDIPKTTFLFEHHEASIHDTDPYGLGLLYYAAYYCWRSHGAKRAMQLCSLLIKAGVNLNWLDDIGNNPMYTMLDSALVTTAMSGGCSIDFGLYCADISALFGLTLSQASNEYLHSRGFTPLHQVLLRINTNETLEDFLQSAHQKGDLHTLIHEPDSHYRTPMAWAVEFGWPSAVETLLRYGADPCQLTLSAKGYSTLLHLVLAGSPSQFANVGFRGVVQSLLAWGVDVNTQDHEGWTPLHITASWGYALHELLSHRELKWNMYTDDGKGVGDLSPGGNFSNVIII